MSRDDDDYDPEILDFNEELDARAARDMEEDGMPTSPLMFDTIGTGTPEMDPREFDYDEDVYALGPLDPNVLEDSSKMKKWNSFDDAIRTHNKTFAPEFYEMQREEIAAAKASAAKLAQKQKRSKNTRRKNIENMRNNNSKKGGRRKRSSARRSKRSRSRKSRRNKRSRK